jgi:hypothetical protein
MLLSATLDLEYGYRSAHLIVRSIRFLASATIEWEVNCADLMVQPSLTRRDDEPRRYRAFISFEN